MTTSNTKYIKPMTSISNSQLSITSSPTDGGTNRELWRVFDGLYNTNAIFTTSNTFWILMNFSEPVAFNKVEFGGLNIATTALPKDIKIEASNDNINFTTLVTKNNLTWTAPSATIPQINAIEWDNSTKYKYYKFTSLANGNGTGITYLYELNFFERLPVNKFLISLNDKKVVSIDNTSVTLTELPSLSEQNFINYGMEDNTELDLYEQMTSKSYILQPHSILGNGKVFNKVINTSEIPIKKVEIK